jgi:hypothetical protein
MNGVPTASIAHVHAKTRELAPLPCAAVAMLRDVIDLRRRDHLDIVAATAAHQQVTDPR